MKKSAKILSAVLALVLVAALSVGGTLAYLTAKDQVVNTFTVGKVQIKLDEAKVDAKGQALVPETRVKTNDYHMIPGVNMDKDPTVTVLAGSEECYVRVLVTISCASTLYDLYTDEEGELKISQLLLGLSPDWVFTKMTDDADTDTLTLEYRYKKAVAPSDTDTKLAPVFTGIGVSSLFDNEELENLQNMTIDVVAQAVQAQTFDNESFAWSFGFDAQNS